jgi:bifunctional UDP-N-acetylglucosamine pyrophosphorylase/glucosamine-1-phosphate N-acetyltransferase
MQAVILAAGRGKRLKPLTDEIPKPMVPVAGRPILEYTLSILPKEIDEVILVIGYKGEKIKNYFGPSFNQLKLLYVEQSEPLGTAHALCCAKPFLKNDYFLLLYADDLYHPDDLENCLINNPSVLVKETDQPEKFGICLIDEKNILCHILEKQPIGLGNLANIGVYLLNQEIFEIMPPVTRNGEFNLASQIGFWAKYRSIKVIKAKFWHPIAYPEDLKLAEHYLHLPVEKRIN